MQLVGTVVNSPTNRKALERRLIEVYTSLANAPKDEHGFRIATLARYGVYEVRMIEPATEPKSEAELFLVELFDHRDRSSLDSFGGFDLEDAASGLEELISQAQMLHQKPTRS